MGCVMGPGENPLKPGEIAIRIDRCMECSKRMPFGFPDIVGIDAWSPEDGDFIKWGALCSKHMDMARYRQVFGTGRVEEIK